MNDTIVDKELILAAITVRERAYAPYSGYLVGASIRDETGAIHIGVNVENAAYPQGQCAEASAIGTMIANGGTRITAIAVVGAGDELCTPCGGCRQRIREFASPDTPIFISDPKGHRETYTLADLLPASFGPDNLR